MVRRFISVPTSSRAAAQILLVSLEYMLSLICYVVLRGSPVIDLCNHSLFGAPSLSLVPWSLGTRSYFGTCDYGYFGTGCCSSGSSLNSAPGMLLRVRKG